MTDRLESAAQGGPPDRFSRSWTLEAVRLRERHHGPLDDLAIFHDVLNHPGSLDDKLLFRAERLAAQNRLADYIRQYPAYLKWSQILLCGAGACLGVGCARLALASPEGQVNLGAAWAALLGPAFFSLLLWVASMLLGRDSTVLGRLWLNLSRFFSRQDDRSLAANALINVLRREHLLSAYLSRSSHLFWLCSLLGSLACLLFLLSTRSYHFVWATTILPADSFDRVSHWLGYLPSLIGFPTPDQLPLAADRAGSYASSSRLLDRQWSAWLIGQMVCWGLLPRLLLAAALSVLIGRRRRRIQPHVAHPDLAPLRQRLQQHLSRLEPDAPAPSPQTLTPQPTALRPQHGSGAAAAGIELSPALPWPPPGLNAAVDDLGNIDSREARHRLNQYLSSRAPLQDLLLVCDGSRAPDRGQLNYLAQVLPRSVRSSVLLLAASPDVRRDYTDLWRARLAELDVRPVHILASPDDLSSWPQ